MQVALPGMGEYVTEFTFTYMWFIGRRCWMMQRRGPP